MVEDPGFWSQNWDWITTVIGLVIAALAVFVPLYLGKKGPFGQTQTEGRGNIQSSNTGGSPNITSGNRETEGVHTETVHGSQHIHHGVDGDTLLEKLLSTRSERDAAQGKVGQLETALETKEEEKKRLQSALDDLQARQEAEDPPPGIEDALRLIEEKGDSAAAENIFREIAEQKKKEGVAAHRETARALRNLGALAFLHDSEKALVAYNEAVQLDPDDADGWNQLGSLRYRTGQIDGAFEAFERVLSLGNAVKDKSLIAIATGNLGNLYKTRGDLKKAEEFYLKSLALNAELGRKEGMARQYGNLGTLFEARGDVDLACENWAKSRDLYAEIGIAGMVEKVAGWIDEAGCSQKVSDSE